jgi:molybdopterin guanine dinucleotide-containing S/N-oxide reductase-like protein
MFTGKELAVNSHELPGQSTLQNTAEIKPDRSYVCPYCSVEVGANPNQLKSHIDQEHPAEQAASPAREPEETYLKGAATNSFGHGGGATRVDTKNGKIVRIRPLHYDEKYTAEEIGKWRVKARGKVFESQPRTLPNPHGLAYKKRVYSPNRIKFPLKRADWDPKGERNPQNRGRSLFKRISWDEATDIIVSEIKRVKAQYGPYAILLQGDGHGETKIVHAPHGCNTRLFECISQDKTKGEFTMIVRNPDSWEGWKWGGVHMWGMEPLGTAKPVTNVFKDVAEHSDILFFWGGDWETTSWQLGGQQASLWAYYYHELGIKMIFVCPDLNFAAGIHADKWIPLYPGTDAALLLALAYTWIVEGTYDKDYVATHTHGFDKFKAYVMGEEDGIAKTPKWAAPLCGVPVWTIKALARQWAGKSASFGTLMSGPFCRGPYSTEHVRMQIACIAMQGFGKPGSNRCHTAPMPRGVISLNPYAAYRGMEEAKQASLRWYPKQFIPKTRLCEAILNHDMEHPLKFYGTGAFLIPRQDQFKEYRYPIPKEEGGSEIHMIWADGPCWQTCWNGGNNIDQAFRSPKIETIIIQHPWLENDCLYADIILPTSTKFESEDIMIGNDDFYQTIYPEGRCVPPVGESLSDYEAVCEVAKKLGVYEELNEGKSVREWMKVGFENSGAETLISWSQLNEKGFFCVPPAKDWESDPAGNIKFYEDPENYPLMTRTGKIEFESTDLLEYFPNDKERPPVPHWIPYGKTHQESRLHPRAKKYPLLMESNHPKWRSHANLDDVSWLREIPTCKVKGFDGYMYEALWIHPLDADKRKIKQRDIVKIYNERGVVLGGAFITERIIPGAVHMDHGARVDFIIPGKVDRGGAINLITPSATTSPHTQGQVGSSFLVEVKKVSLNEMLRWKQEYPEAFSREYDPSSGLYFNGRIEGGA